ncbi:Fanconi anemia core complex-associated protein 20 [Rhea pennata]|uniref:Fanconi anemia core complex-associated protein 20 n=1 Tax=Rhea pennata TaxID=8795 RepID=UPI002E26F6EF
MSQEGAAKLRLKPRKAPPDRRREPSPGQDPPGRRQTLADRWSQFEKDDLSECEKTWISLLKAVNQDLKCTNWQTVPSFPEFFGKSSEEQHRQHSVFKIGMKDFQWISFPSFHKEKHLKPKDLSLSQLTESQTDHLLKEYSQVDEPKSLFSTAEKTCCVTIKDQSRNVAGKNSKGISKLGVNPESSKLTQHKYSTYHLATLQSSAETLGFQQYCRETIQNSKENRKENNSSVSQLQTYRSNVSSGEARSMPAERSSLPVSMPGTESCKEKTEDRSEGTLTLDSCPMCLIQFSGTLSQLDIDGHLARCLSESTDDVMW